MYPESKAENTNKLEKDLLNILSEIQTPQLHQQVILIFFKAVINVITANKHSLTKNVVCMET